MSVLRRQKRQSWVEVVVGYADKRAGSSWLVLSVWEVEVWIRSWEGAKDRHFLFQNHTGPALPPWKRKETLPSLCTPHFMRSQQLTVLLCSMIMWLKPFMMLLLWPIEQWASSNSLRNRFGEHDLFIIWRLNADMRCVLLKVVDCVSQWDFEVQQHVASLSVPCIHALWMIVSLFVFRSFLML